LIEKVDRHFESVVARVDAGARPEPLSIARQADTVARAPRGLSRKERKRWRADVKRGKEADGLVS
jgi:hypothetical protein